MGYSIPITVTIDHTQLQTTNHIAIYYVCISVKILWSWKFLKNGMHNDKLEWLTEELTFGLIYKQISNICIQFYSVNAIVSSGNVCRDMYVHCQAMQNVYYAGNCTFTCMYNSSVLSTDLSLIFTTSTQLWSVWKKWSKCVVINAMLYMHIMFIMSIIALIIL